MYGTHFRFNYGIEHSATKRYITNSLHCAFYRLVELAQCRHDKSNTNLELAPLFERESSSVKKRAKWIQPNCGISELVGLLELWESQRLCLLR
ncbi:unnamed protein product [Schistosoma intercalatum]|nr:unnamed protein product [Schistosoma intercalatum]